MKNLSKRSQGLIAINVVAIIFGSAALYGKLNVSPFWIVAARSGFAVITLLLLGGFQQKLGKLPQSLWKTTFITGFMLAIHWLAFFGAVQRAGVAIATLSFATFPMFTVLFEAALRKRFPSIKEFSATVAIMIAVGLLVDVRHHGDNRFWGAILGLVSALTFAWFGISSKNLSSILSPLLVSLYQNTVVALMLLPFVFFMKPMPTQPQEWLCLISLGVVTTAVVHQLYFYALQRLPTSACNGFAALEPVYAILFAALFFKEQISLVVIVSGALIVGASILLLKQESVHSPELESVGI